jgi:hypothetical protein
MTIEEVIAEIIKLEQEREQIYEDSGVTPEEHPRLAHIEAELPKLWDLRRRLEAAKAAGVTYHLPLLERISACPRLTWPGFAPSSLHWPRRSTTSR